MKPDWVKGDAEPNNRVGESPKAKAFVAGAKLEKDARDYKRRQLVRWSWLRIESHFGHHFDEREIAIELRLPWRIRVGLNSPFRVHFARSYVVVFGRVHTRLLNGAWHVRGGPSIWNNPF